MNNAKDLYKDKKIGKFHYQGNELYCEEVRVADIVSEVGTPTYIYSLGEILYRYQLAEDALQDIDHIICYSVKANSHLAILKALVRKGAGIDIVSRGELYRAVQVGALSSKIVFAGVGKKEDEIRYALRNNILMFNVESLPEIRKINDIAVSMDKEARIAIRVNPDVDAKTHQYITTGKKETKFGVPLYQVDEFMQTIRQMKRVKLIGIHCHIGSQILTIEPYIQALEKVLKLIADLRSAGEQIDYLNLGGGMGIQYDDAEQPFAMADWGQQIINMTKKMDLTLIIEPGRSIVGNSGALLTRTIYVKQGHNKKFIITDGAMNDLIRPSLYSGYHQIWPVALKDSQTTIYDVVGPICESGDFLGKNRELGDMAENDLLAVMSAGAYGYAMVSNYNSRSVPAEVLVSGHRYFIIRERPEIETLIEGEKIPPVV